MKILAKITLKNLVANKRQTLITIIGVMLTCGMISAVIAIVSTLIGLLIDTEKAMTGDWHAKIYDISEEQTQLLSQKSFTDMLEGVFYTNNEGYIPLKEDKVEDYTKYIGIISADKEDIGKLGMSLAEGRMPENENEIVLPYPTVSGLEYQIGETVTLELGIRKMVYPSGEEIVIWQKYYWGGQTEDGNSIFEELYPYKTKTYTVVGYTVVRTPGGVVSASLPAITIKSEAAPFASGNVYLTAKAGVNIYDLCRGLVDNSDFWISSFEYNNILLSYLGYENPDAFYNTPNNSLSVIYIITGVIIILIMLGTVLLIYNAFAISVSQRTRQYGVFSGSGATPKQIRYSVLYEAVFISVIGIPLGIISGYSVIALLLHLFGDMLISMTNLYSLVGTGFKINMAISWQATLIAAVIGLLTIFISAYIPAKRASRLTAIEAIRQSSDIKYKEKKISRLWQKTLGVEGELAAKSFKRSKRRYRATLVSLIISIVMYIGISELISYLNETVKLNLGHSDYDIEISANNIDTFEDEIYSAIDDTFGIEKYSIVKELFLSAVLDKNSFTDNFSVFYEEFKNTTDKYSSMNTEFMFSGIKPRSDGKAELNISFKSIDDDSFIKFLKSNGLNPDEYTNPEKPNGILYNSILVGDNTDLVFKSAPLSTELNYIYYENFNEVKKSAEINITGLVTGLKPDKSTNKTHYPTIYVSETVYKEIMKDIGDAAECWGKFIIYTDTDDITVTEALSAKLSGPLKSGELVVSNIKEEYKKIDTILQIVSIFGNFFVIMIGLICGANILNTVSTSIKLRRREFAVLRSVGMNKKSFNKMIMIESAFYSIKSLLYGLPLGIVISYLVFLIIREDALLSYAFPVTNSVICVLAVGALIIITMLYSLGKIRKDNIIETIRTENC